MPRNKLGDNLKALRAAKGYTQAEAAKLVDVSAPAYSAYESGKSVPPLNTLIFFAKHYRVSLDWLCGIEKTNIYDKIVSAASVYAFIFTLSPKNRELFFSGKMKFTQFTEHASFQRLTPVQQMYLYEQYEQDDWKKAQEEEEKE